VTPVIAGLAPLATLLLGCAPRLRPPDVAYGDPLALPLVQPSTDHRRWYVPMETASLGPVVWFVDTGYTWSTCDDGLIDALGLEPRGRVPVHGEIGRAIAQKVEIPPMSLGGHEIERLRCQVRDLGTTSSLDDPREVPIAGVLGMDLLRQFRVVFDPHAGEMWLMPPDDQPPLTAGEPGTVRMRRSGFRGNRALVRLQVGDRQVWQILDTGATNTYVDGRRLGLEHATTVPNVTVRGTGTSNQQVRELVSWEADEVGLGGHQIGRATLIDRDRAWWEPGLLGLDLLGRFHQEYDFARGLARLTPSRPLPLPQFSAYWPARGALASSLSDGDGVDRAGDGLSDPE
jgi:hypothetical protein